MPAPTTKHVWTSDKTKCIIAAFLDESTMVDGKRVLARGAVNRVCFKFKGLTERTARRLWQRALKNHDLHGIYSASPQKKGRCGRKQIYDREELQDAIAAVPRGQRGSLRGVAAGVGISHMQMQRLVKEGSVCLPHSSALKPLLTEADKVSRVLYCAERIREDETGSFVYDGAYEEIHVDEKWFYITPQSQKVYLTLKELEEDIPHRTCMHKSHILKVMFLCAVARPRFNEEGVCIFDGKIGIWPFTERRQAERNSVNRPRGTWETHCVPVTKALYTDFICNKVIPSATSKWPRDRSSRTQLIAIQQDNPNTHMGNTDPQWLLAKDSDPRFKFYLGEQPTRSPDTNILDLGFFRSLECATWKLKRASNIDGLIANVEEAWNEYEPELLNKIWLSHQACLNAILECHGNNDYKLPHLGKDHLANTTGLPDQVEVSCEALAVARSLRDI
eukprot:scaffold283_cov186-Amphora_coffeaeformis.AAC.7